jgi:TDG/mug DNA glycosylase family protein
VTSSGAEQVLQDLLRDNLDIVFCGTQAGAASALRRAYYAGPGNRFWRTLHEIELVPLLLDPHEYRKLLEFRIGLTDVAKRTSGPDAALRRGHFDVEGFRKKIGHYAPRIVAFNGKKSAAIALRSSSTELIYGPQRTKIGNAAVFVLPSTSGAAQGYWDIAPWRALSAALRKAG